MKKKTKKPATATAAKTETEEAKSVEPQVEKKKDFEADYFQLLDRINDTLKKNNPSLQEAPQIEKQGKKTNWLNFMDIVNKMKRDPNHVQQFVVSELGTEGAIANNTLSKIEFINQI